MSYVSNSVEEPRPETPYDRGVKVQDLGFFPLSTVEIKQYFDRLKDGCRRGEPRADLTWPEVGRLLATIEWFHRRDVDIATRLGNPREELDLLFDPNEVEKIVQLKFSEDT